jgi:hypothetical protein
MCIVPGCNEARYLPKAKYSRLKKVCRKHWIAILSGRVGCNWHRDKHNFHRKGYCEMCGVTAYQIGKVIVDMQSVAHGSPVDVRRRDIIKQGMKVLQGDHIDGRNNDNPHAAENIQTLCPNCHRVKTIVNKDCVPYWTR